MFNPTRDDAVPIIHYDERDLFHRLYNGEYFYKYKDYKMNEYPGKLDGPMYKKISSHSAIRHKGFEEEIFTDDNFDVIPVMYKDDIGCWVTKRHETKLTYGFNMYPEEDFLLQELNDPNNILKDLL